MQQKIVTFTHNQPDNPNTQECQLDSDMLVLAENSVFNGDVEGLKNLLQHPNNAKLIGSYKQVNCETLLNFAIWEGQNECAVLLIPHTDITPKGKYLWSPIHYAVACANKGMLELMLAHPLALQAMGYDYEGRNLVHIALNFWEVSDKNTSQIFDLVWNAQKRYSEANSDERGIKDMQSWLCYLMGESPLKSLEASTHLLKKMQHQKSEWDINAKNQDGKTALWKLIERWEGDESHFQEDKDAHIKLLKLMLEFGADFHQIKTKEGVTVLERAYQLGHQTACHIMNEFYAIHIEKKALERATESLQVQNQAPGAPKIGLKRL